MTGAGRTAEERVVEVAHDALTQLVRDVVVAGVPPPAAPVPLAARPRLLVVEVGRSVNRFERRGDAR